MNEQRDEAMSADLELENENPTLITDQQSDAADLDGEGDAPDVPSSGSAGDDLEGLVTFIVSNLLDDTEEIEVEAEQRDSSVHLRLRVPQDDLGKVIGRQGRVAKAMRTALTIAGSRHNVRASLDIEG